MKKRLWYVDSLYYSTIDGEHIEFGNARAMLASKCPSEIRPLTGPYKEWTLDITSVG